ncbi:uncharacterized protein METZ01_LOCUS265379 [marine metagenome]|uniref:Uncharacterized protein n=1 Tax=marine metagenome TaxID=408172 RepID=A0A382JLG1_9ZZZZ
MPQQFGDKRNRIGTEEKFSSNAKV